MCYRSFNILVSVLENVFSTELYPQEGQKNALPITEYLELHFSQVIFFSNISLDGIGNIIFSYAKPLTGTHRHG